MQAESKSELDERSRERGDDKDSTIKDKRDIDSKTTPCDVKVGGRDRDRDRVRDSKTATGPGSMSQQPETLGSRRNKKWAAFARSKVCFGFKHLPADSIPSIVPDTRGIAVCLERIGGWIIPTAVQREIQRSKNDYGSKLYQIINSICFLHSNMTFF